MEYLDDNKSRGNIENIINSTRSILFEDKISILDLQSQGFKTPKSYHFNEFNELKNFIKKSGEEYIVKHRYGQEGFQMGIINSENVGSVKDWILSDYIVQEKLQTTDEKRLIFYGDELLASRIIFDRSNPWEKGGPNERSSVTEPYTPTSKEIQDSIDIMKFSDTTVGCVDWVNTKQGEQYYMELNGFGTGYGRGTHPYNVNKEVSSRLKKDFISNRN